jgi:hypothetical protein
MTQLASITNNHLALKCEMCGHQSMIAVQHLSGMLSGKQNTTKVQNAPQSLPSLYLSRHPSGGMVAF